ncbi:MAG: Bro-N domain-containing protein [Rhodospirillales bacterium]|nr:Bro-N domain-containing protein [Rhodospirillales bacterium]
MGSWDVRVIDQDGEPWFVLADVCRVLEIGNPSDAARRLDEDEKAALDIIDTSSNGVRQSRLLTGISEPGLYSVILTSRTLRAAPFKRWVTHEVLPSIRRHGIYVSGQEKVRTGEMTLAELGPSYSPESACRRVSASTSSRSARMRTSSASPRAASQSIRACSATLRTSS